ncbi:MAG: polysaccharide deacetylase family protein [Fibrobacterota bacterium]
MRSTKLACAAFLFLFTLGCTKMEVTEDMSVYDRSDEEGVIDPSILPENPDAYRVTPPQNDVDRKPSQSPPLGLSPEDVPQFIIIGSDDNTSEEGINWLLDLIEGKKNPAGNQNPATFDGSPLTLSLYWNSDNSGFAHEPGVIDGLKRAVALNCEVANHTAHHRHGGSFTREDWKREMARVNKILLEEGIITKDSEIGFRTPFLEFNKNTFQAAREMGMNYDCSTVEGGSAKQDSLVPGNYHWPYTMNYTIPGYDGSWWQGQLLQNHSEYALNGSEKTDNMWQLPCYSFLAPPDSVLEEYGYETGLRDFMQSVIDWESNGKITGLDYNMWAPGDHGGFELNKEQSLATLRYTLDKKYSGNRTPLTLGMHSQFYFEEDKFANISNTEQREFLEEFIDYALTLEDVRIVSAQEFLRWYENPVALR